MRLNQLMRRRYRWMRLLLLVTVCIVGYLGILLPVAIWNSYPSDMVEVVESHSFRKLLSNSTEDEGFKYPPDVFSIEDRRKGAVVLHVIGMIYMFVALAIICDDFFVPSLNVIIERLHISEDVAGATFMAAGGSAPELFTSLVGVFFSKDNVGIGTIVGSAVFNILFVIGMCAIFSKKVLDLTWWPLFRDVTFYSIDLALLIGFFIDGVIEWWEALVLFIMYVLYVLFMFFNTRIELFVKSKIQRRKSRIHSSDNLLRQRAARSCSIPILHSGTNRFRHGVLQLMIHTIDPISESVVHDKAMRLHAVASVNLVIDSTDLTSDDTSTPIRNGNTRNGHKHVSAISNGQMATNNSHTESNNINQYSSPITSVDSPNLDSIPQDAQSPDSSQQQGSSSNNTETELPEENDEPLDLSWPDTWRRRIVYILVMPLVFPMWLFLPDTRDPEKKKWFLVTFFGSILGIAIFSYMMVWWANQIGETIGIPSEIMGLTILAAGTSIPDLITSVIVAKKGFGDMAVSSSVGSNIFDITVGLPIPWLLYSAIYLGAPINVDSQGLACSIVLLFAMLMTVLITIGVSKWRMTKVMGGAMIALYFVFVVLSVLLELGIIECPVTG